MSGGTQKKIGKVRPPRVQITYDVETGDAVNQKSLPFVVGVLADLNPGGANETRLRDRSFVSIDGDNFDKVMSAVNPTVAVTVPNKLSSEGGNMRLEMSFSELDAFSPGRVAKSVPQLNQLLEARERLNDLLAKLEGNDKLNDLLAEVVLNTEVQVKACSEQREREQQPDTTGKTPE